ncbi:ferredoxin [Herbaspirillum sp. RTI4]|uniref:(2Fe-2S) ferredoxin domain-containing protein n=1 Tax=Herbaspirillum sp. RTI4 TaxID=3048640 RepID=UPI002AB374D3|nr:ferredoxin [Herbaspirillum sp. RTI4]MDY7579550.1 ferredoxin [Herbaspirillum sp. RTI4]MEA9981821.1 ferredoxin [Herbaspirillum sp. RTI4]
MRTHTRHVLMCTGPRCTEDGVHSEAMFARLGAAIDARPQLRVKRTRTQCMVACKNQGPLLVVYPEGIWYRCHDGEALERIVEEHLEHGREVSDLVFHRLGSGDVDPPEDQDVSIPPEPLA